MTGHLIAHAIRARLLAISIMTTLLLFLWSGLGGLAHARAMAGSASPAVPANDIASGFAIRAGWIVVMMGVFIGPGIAFSVFNDRAFFVLPVSSRDYWRARWLVGTVGTATCAAFARFAGFALQGLFARPLVGPEALAITWLLTFAFCGSIFGIVAIVASTPRLATLFRHLVTSGPLLVRLCGAALFGAAATFSMAFLMVRLRGSFGWTAGLAAAAAVLLAIRGYRHDPANSSTASMGSIRPSVARREPIERHAQDHRTGVRMLLWRELLWTWGASSLLLVFLLLPSGNGFGGAFPQFQSEFSSGLRYDGGGMLWGIPGVWLFLLMLSGRNGLIPLVRQLRALPISALLFDSMFVGIAAVYWLCVMAMFTAVMLATTGAVPHFAFSSFVLCLGITAFCHSLQLAVDLVFGGWTEIILAIGVVQLVSRAAAALNLGTPAVATTLGLVLIVAASFLNLRLLGRSATYRRRWLDRRFLAGARA